MLEIFRPFIHYGIHFGMPFAIAYYAYPKTFKKGLLILLAGILIDVDHLWATPFFQSDRCSVGFHLFHQWPFIGAYLLLVVWPKTRIFGYALLLHIIADLTDCGLMNL